MPQLDPVLIFFQSILLIFFYLFFYFVFFRVSYFPFFFFNFRFNYYFLNILYNNLIFFFKLRTNLLYYIKFLNLFFISILVEQSIMNIKFIFQIYILSLYNFFCKLSYLFYISLVKDFSLTNINSKLLEFKKLLLKYESLSVNGSLILVDIKKLDKYNF